MGNADRGNPRQRQGGQTSGSRNNPDYYQASSAHYHAKKSSNGPIVVLVVILLVALVGLGFAVMNLLNGKPSSQTGNSQGSNQMVATDTSAPEQTTAKDTSGGQIVMTLQGSQDTIVLKGESYIESGCHATDKETGSVTSSVKVSGNVDTNKAGDYTVTYTATNAKGKTATKTRTVHVVEDMDVDTDGISVLMYHYIYHEEPVEHNSNYLEDVKFEEQLQWLQSEGFYYPSYAELRAYIEGTHSLPSKSVVLTFDDGEAGFLEYGIPLLNKYQVPATSFLICSDDDALEKVTNYASEYCTFQSHTYGLHTAGYSGRGKGGAIYDYTIDELVADFKSCEAILGPYEALAYPFGDQCEEAREAINKAGLLCAFTVEYDQVHKGDDPTQLSRIRVFADSALSSYTVQVADGA